MPEPRCLTREQAAAYVGVSVPMFNAEVAAGVWPSGRARGPKGTKQTWDQRLLDAAIDRQSGLDNSHDVYKLGNKSATQAWEERIHASIHNKRAEGSKKNAQRR